MSRKDQTTIAGRFFWDPAHPTPWVGFRNITEYRTWARNVRRELPGTKCEWHYVGLIHTAETLLRAAKERREEYTR